MSVVDNAHIVLYMKKYLCFLLLSGLFLCPKISLAQQEDNDVNYHYQSNDDAVQQHIEQVEKKNAILSKIGVGGTAGLQFGSYFHVELSPDVTYHFNKWVCVGAGGTYMLTYMNTTGFKDFSHVFGARVFVEPHFFNYLALHVEYQWLNYDLYTIFNNRYSVNRTNSHNILLGGGYYQRAGRVAIYLLLFYNLSDKKYPDNILDSFVVKAGFTYFLK